MTSARRFIGTAILIVLMGVAVLPFLGILLTALQPAGLPPNGLGLPDKLHWENFATAWDVTDFPVLMKSSAMISAAVVPLGILVCTMAGFALGHLKVPFAKGFFALFMVGLVLPYEAAIVALYDLVRDIGILGTRWAIILPLVGLLVPFGVFWMRGHFAAIPRELSESARIDGAGSFRLFFSIHLPLALPAIMLLALTQFMAAWNQYMLAIVLVDDPNKRTLGGALGAFQGSYSTDIVMMSAGGLLLMAPTLLAFVFMQRFFMKSLMAGAVKG